MWEKIKPYLISILISLGVGGLSAFLTRNSMDIYENLNQPPLSPPSILFPIVWSILFILMGISAAIIYTYKEEEPATVKDALVVYAISLFFNFFWTMIFFNMRAYLFAFIWLIALWILIILTINAYKKINPLAAYLQILLISCYFHQAEAAKQKIRQPIQSAAVSFCRDIFQHLANILFCLKSGNHNFVSTAKAF